MDYLSGQRHLQKHRAESEIVSAEFADAAFELPEGAAKQYELVSPYPDQPVGKVGRSKRGRRPSLS
jgi:hypothetical protein